jgi:3-carboxy-cis,cis-muconate cycloisomerase
MLLAEQFTDPAIERVFADEQLLAQLLRVETTLAQVQARLGVIPAAAAHAISRAAHSLRVDVERLKIETERDGVPIIELVRQLREHAGEAGQYVHWGATTQDILDTALVLQMREALGVLERNLLSLISNLASLADRHRRTLMAGRTHSQHALPITFGFKAAAWLASLMRHRERLEQLKPRLLVVQFGGAVGTLASLGEGGVRVQEALASELSLGLSTMPWHTQRDALAEVASWLSLVTGSLAKMAQDIILLAQSEVGELNETSDASRGGSSTMPQKSNPIISERIVAAARMNASLLSDMHHALIQEHERATHGWQLEWLCLPQMFSLAAGALKSAVFLSENLVVNEERMRENVSASNGSMLAERLSFALSSVMSRAEAKTLLKEASQDAVQQRRHLVDVLRERVSASLDWDGLRSEATYLGATQAWIDRVFTSGAAILRDVAYAREGHPRQTLDLFLPREGENMPLIIWVHGGAWRLGSKEDQPPLHYLAAGYAVASLNYRLSQHALFPAQLEDCKAAVRWLRAHAQQFKLDAQRFGAWGPSAGGHLVALLGTTGHIRQFDVGEDAHVSSQVQAVVDCFGPTDFLQMDSHRLANGMLHDPPDSPESALVGGPIQQNKDKVERANPITYVTRDAPPFLIIHGDADPLVPYHQSRLLADALQHARAPVTFHTVIGGGHGEFMRRAEIQALIRSFFDRHLNRSKTGY